jgi:uncharacterized protein (TIGR03435 family)
MSKFIGCNLFLAAAVTRAVLAQSPTVPKQFDVVAIKPNADNDNRWAFRTSGGRGFTATGVTLKFLIAEAYHVRAYQIPGGPGWIGTERWDLRAKVEGIEGRLQRDQFDTMFRTLLEDRFQLKVHIDTKEMPVYALVVGKNGSKLIAHTASPSSPAGTSNSGRGSLTVEKEGTARLANLLSLQLGRTVIDKTGLKGEYDFKLEWAYEQGQGGPEAFGLPPDSPRTPPVEANGPSIFTAVQEQLGLRLESQKGPVEILVIDHAEKPSEN